mmetsp:Transcript_953/g.2745  ORF Transcript_953/g.2745 Transcript_953/m.2745 type:complete len:166 (-) Transcript_953:187-684(-)
MSNRRRIRKKQSKEVKKGARLTVSSVHARQMDRKVQSERERSTSLRVVPCCSLRFGSGLPSLSCLQYGQGLWMPTLAEIDGASCVLQMLSSMSAVANNLTAARTTTPPSSGAFGPKYEYSACVHACVRAMIGCMRCRTDQLLFAINVASAHGHIHIHVLEKTAAA